MLKVSFDIFTYLLAIYGLIYMTTSVVNSIRQRLCIESSRVKVILLVKDQERTIEGIIRNIYTGDILRKVMTSEKLSIVDMGSKDGTVDILEKLSSDYGYFEIIDEKDRDKVFSDFDSGAINDKENKADSLC